MVGYGDKSMTETIDSFFMDESESMDYSFDKSGNLYYQITHKDAINHIDASKIRYDYTQINTNKRNLWMRNDNNENIYIRKDIMNVIETITYPDSKISKYETYKIQKTIRGEKVEFENRGDLISETVKKHKSKVLKKALKYKSTFTKVYPKVIRKKKVVSLSMDVLLNFENKMVNTDFQRDIRDTIQYLFGIGYCMNLIDLYSKLDKTYQLTNGFQDVAIEFNNFIDAIVRYCGKYEVYKNSEGELIVSKKTRGKFRLITVKDLEKINN